MKRRAIAHPIMVLFGFFIIGGVVWIGVYYGAILPIYNSLTGTYTTSIFDTNTITFVLGVALYFPFILTIGGLYWLWQQSQKRRSYYE